MKWKLRVIINNIFNMKEKAELEQENAVLQSAIAEIKAAYDQLKVDIEVANENIRALSIENSNLKEEARLFNARQQVGMQAENNKFY